MPIVTPRLVLRPPTLDDLDAIQAAKEDAWNDLQLWMAWAFDNQRPRQALEHSIRRTMNFQSRRDRHSGREVSGSAVHYWKQRRIHELAARPQREWDDLESC